MSVASQARKELSLRILAAMGLLLVLAVIGAVGWTAFSVRSARPKFDLGAGHSDSVLSVAWSPDGQRVASASQDHTLRVWNAASGQMLRIFTGHSSVVTSVVWSPDGKQLASGSLDKTVKVWDVESGQPLRTVPGNSQSVWSVAWSPDGKQLAGGSEGGVIKIWDSKSGQLLQTVKGHSLSVFAVAWSRDGAKFASASEYGEVKLWDSATWQPVRTIEGSSSNVNAVAWSPDAKQLASLSAFNMVKIWDVANGHSPRTITVSPVRAKSVAWSPDGKQLATSSDENLVKVWDAGSGQLLRTLPGHSLAVNAVAWSPDGKSLASASEDKTVRVWETGTWQLRRTMAAHASAVRSVAWSRDGKEIASGDEDHLVKIWNSTTGQSRRILTGQSERVFSVAWSPDSTRVASGGGGSEVKVWDSSGGQPLQSMSWPTDGVHSVAWSPDGNRLAAGSEDGIVKVWDPKSGQRTGLLVGYSGSVFAVGWSPDGKQLLIGGSDMTMQVRDAGSEQVPHKLIGHSGAVRSVSWSPDGKRVASGSDDHTVKVWDAGSGQLHRTLAGHSDAVNSVAWSPDGKQLASGSGDNTVKVWEAESGQSRRTLTGHSASVQSVAWSPDGKRLASGSLDGAIGLWKLEAEGENLFLANLTQPGKSLVINPSGFRYECSDREDENVEITFTEPWRTRYRLADFRDQPGVVLRPSVPTETYAFLLRNFSVFGFFALVYLAGAGGLLWGTRERSAVDLARRFFPRASYTVSKTLGPDIFVLAGGEPAFAAVWPQPEDKLIDSIARNRKGITGRFRTYLICRASDPESVTRIGNRLNCVVIPLDASRLERAIADDNANETLREMEEPFLARTDPYDEARAITDPTWFYGRSALLDELPAVLRQGQHAGVFGLRKVGKTSLLSQLRLRMIEAPVVWLDCQAYDPAAADLLLEILSRFGNEAKRLHGLEPPPPAGGKSINELRNQLIGLHDRWKEKSGERFILILDEIDKWFPDRRDPNNEADLLEFVKLFRLLRALAQERGMLTILVAAYRPDVNRQNLLQTATGENPMYMSFQEKFIGFLGEKDTRQMICEIGAWKEIVWSDEALDMVYRACGGHPMLTRFLASEACAQGTKKQVDRQDLQRVYDKVCDNFRRHRIGVYFEESVWAMLRNDERDSLLWAVSEPDGPPPAAWEDALVNLEHFGLIQAEGGALRVNGDLFRNWLRKRSE